MSSGGMDWAYRMIAAHSLDPLGLAVVLHLGWRDVAAQRTDRGIARALRQHATSIAKATAKLAALGIIARRSGLWVACETIAIVEETALPSAAKKEPEPQAPNSGVRTTELGGAAQLSWAALHNSVGHKRREKNKKEAQAIRASEIRRNPAPSKTPASLGVESLTAFQRASVFADRSVLVCDRLIAAGSAEMVALRHSLRLLGNENKGYAAAGAL